MENDNKNEKDVRELIENWAKAVRNKDIDAILAFHSTNLVMYDVPEPFQSAGLDEYRKTWDLFFGCAGRIVFDILELNIVADDQVAFAFGKLECLDKNEQGDYVPLFFRLTVGLKKIKGEWSILHEHHSVPAPLGFENQIQE
jgi:ketosteroid isomerase-like protein